MIGYSDNYSPYRFGEDEVDIRDPEQIERDEIDAMLNEYRMRIQKINVMYVEEEEKKHASDIIKTGIVIA